MATAVSTTNTSTSVSRLQNILSHVQKNSVTDPIQRLKQLSIVHGPTDPPLVYLTLGGLLTLQSLQYRDNECVVCPETGARWTYGFLEQESHQLARGLLALGVTRGDRVGVMAGNCEQYVALIFAAARVGAILVVLNNMYTTSELMFALYHTGISPGQRRGYGLELTDPCAECKLLFIVPHIARHSNVDALDILGPHPRKSQTSLLLESTIILRGEYKDFPTYDVVIAEGIAIPSHAVWRREEELSQHDVCNLQFTSGSTGNPKAAMLTHQSVETISAVVI